MSRIKQFGVGVDTDVFVRLERLRACLGESRSRVVEIALTGGGLGKLEREHAADVDMFDKLAVRLGKTWQEYAQEYGQRWAKQTYPPKVSELIEIEGASTNAELAVTFD